VLACQGCCTYDRYESYKRLGDGKVEEEHCETQGPGTAPEVPVIATDHGMFWWSDRCWWLTGGQPSTGLVGDLNMKNAWAIVEYM
jgi:hypothetical protein